MANYLGKISALVTANTRDFDQKLNASAKEVSRFAGSIGRDLNSASSRAVKSLSEIYTQAQKVERALQAATSGRLDFKGVREFIDNLRSADNSVQSLEKSVRRLSSGQQAELLSRSSFASIDEFIAKFRQAGQLKNALDDQKVRVALEFIGVEEARRKLQQLASVDFEISGPLQRAVVEVQKFPAAIQRSLNPALTEAQLLVQGLENEIRDGAVISEQAFDRAAKSVEKFNAVVARASEARRLVGGLQTGNEIAFANPNFVQAQKESAEAQRRAAALSATQLKGNPQVRELVSQIAEVSQEAERLRAKYDQLSTAGSASAASVSASLDGQIRKQRELNSLLEREVTLLESGAEKTGEFVSFPSDAKGTFGPDPLFSTRDPQGRSIQERLSTNLLSGQLNAYNEFIASQQELARKIGNGFLNILTPAEAAVDTLQAREQELGRRIGNGFLNILTPAEAAADTLQAREQELGRRIGNGFLNILTQAEAAADTVAGRVALGRTNSANGLRDAFGGRAESGINFGFEQQALRGYTSQLQVLQQAIGRASAEARGPAVAAFSRLRDAIANAMQRGELETADTRDEIRRLTAEATRAAATVSNVSERSLGRRVDRAGDVGRRGFDNVSLALNQAAFAVDDFLSSTGGLEFKIRAVQNNLTQLGFILGGTTGLFVSLGIAIAGQATVALVNFLNEGRKTEDMVKALNDSLSRQKEVAGEVGAAFEEIGGELRSDVFSDAANDAQRLAERLEQLTDAFKRLREERIAQSSVTAQEAQANINSLDRRLQAEEDPGVRILLQRQLLEARRRAAEVTAGLSEPTTVLGGVARFREAITPLEEFRGSGTQQRLTREQIGRNIDSVISNADIRDLAGLRAAVEARLEETAALVNTGEGAFRAFRGASSDVAADEVGNLQSLLTSIQGFQQAGEALSNAANVSDSIRKSLAEARDRIDEFGEGIESAGRFSDAIDVQGRILEQAVSSISAAFGRLERLEISPEQFRDALNSAAASADAEAVARAQLIRDIEATFNEEERLRLDGAKTAQEADVKRAEEDLKASTERGRQLLLGESGRRAEQIAASIGDIRNAGGGQRQIAGFLAEQARQIAPALFTAGDQILNAVATGPNRAALSASDITTQQGTSELNRLLRGDDPAREQNIVELRKQTAELAGLRQDLRNLQVAD